MCGQLLLIFLVWVLYNFVLNHRLSRLAPQEWVYEIAVGCYYLPLPRRYAPPPSPDEGDYHPGLRPPRGGGELDIAPTIGIFVVHFQQSGIINSESNGNWVRWLSQAYIEPVRKHRYMMLRCICAVISPTLAGELFVIKKGAT